MSKRAAKSISSFAPKGKPRVPRRWQLQDAKAKLSQVIKNSRNAPQIITVHGTEVAVVQSIEDYRRQMTKSGGQTHWLDELLKCPPGPDLIIQRDPKDVIGAGMPNIFD